MILYSAFCFEIFNLVRLQLPNIPKENILCEPIGRNTAPCIGTSAVYIQKKYEDAVMYVLPSDHLITDIDSFACTLLNAAMKAEEGDNIVTIGIKPTYPDTGYGYIETLSTMDSRVYKVSRFVEKPNYDKAKEYVCSGKYYWNSGIFTWRLKTLINKYKVHLPDIYDGLLKISNVIGSSMEQQVLLDTFYSFESISIDYGIMEKSDNVFLIPSSFDWDDVGSWLAVGRLLGKDQNGNSIRGNTISLYSNNSIISAESKLIATLGVSNLVIIDSDDATLICDKSHLEKMKELLSCIRNEDKDKYL